MSEKTCKTALGYLLVFIILECSMAGVLPDKLKWIESDNPDHWLLEKRATAPSLHSYWLRVKQGQSVIDENIVIDTSKKTEQFHVLPFDAADEAIIFTDFNKNWTVIKLPKKNQCFLQKSKPATPPPKRLMVNIDKTIAFNSTNSTVNIDIAEKSSWKVKGRVFNRLLLTAEMNRLCSRTNVYEITRATGQVYIQGLKRKGRSSSDSKKPRSVCGGEVCSYYYMWYCTKYNSKMHKCAYWVKLRYYACQIISC